MILTRLIGNTKKVLASRNWWKDNSPPNLDDEILLTADPRSTYGYFTAAGRSSAGTTVVTSPNADGSMMVTDLIISTDRVNTATVVVQFTDGAETVVLFATDVSDAPANIALSMAGRWQGWRNARIEMVTTGAVTATIALGYTKVPFGLLYSEWDANR